MLLSLSKQATFASIFLAGLCFADGASSSKCGSNRWVDIWGTMPQLVEPANLPPEPFNKTGVVFRDATIRQTLRVGLAASTIRLQISNAFGVSDLPITSVSVAIPAPGPKAVNGSASGSGAIKPGSSRTVTFSSGRSTSFTIPNGALALSDPIEDFTVEAQSDIAVTIYLAQGQTTNYLTGHPGSRTTSHFAPGSHLEAEDLSAVAGAASADHWYFLTSVEGWLPRRQAASLVVVGDSITDGRGSTTNGNDRWTDALQTRLRGAQNGTTAAVAVINEAAGGNRVLADGLGPHALGRIGRDVLERSSARWALLFEGVNDIGTAASTAGAQAAVGDALIGAYEQMIARLHGRGLAVFGATITPFVGEGQGYGTPEREEARRRVNRWIRESGRFDAVVDFDEAVRDPGDESRLRPEYDTGDHLHLNPQGYRAMADAVDLGLFDKFAGGVYSMI